MASGVVLSLDLGTTTGWCIGHWSDPVPLMGAFTMSDVQGLGYRFAKYHKWLNRQIDSYDPERGTFEHIIPRGKKLGLIVPAILHGLAGITRMVCAERHIPCDEATPNEIKLWFTGYGRAEKAEMMAECVRRGWNAPGQDAADATALWAYTIDQFYPQSRGRHVP
jgi:Holliday junction resolvasome RuvABC endonuclease subunit